MITPALPNSSFDKHLQYSWPACPGQRIRSTPDWLCLGKPTHFLSEPVSSQAKKDGLLSRHRRVQKYMHVFCEVVCKLIGILLLSSCNCYQLTHFLGIRLHRSWKLWNPVWASLLVFCVRKIRPFQVGCFKNSMRFPWPSSFYSWGFELAVLENHRNETMCHL